MVTLFYSSLVASNSKWVEAQGSAIIERGDLISAKNRAYRDALNNASQQVNVQQ